MRISGFCLAVLISGVVAGCTAAGNGRLEVDTVGPSVFQPIPTQDLGIFRRDTSKALGYADSALGDGRYEVTVAANSFTTQSRAMSIALVRAAELAASSGNDLFVLDRSDSNIRCFSVQSTAFPFQKGPVAFGRPIATIAIASRLEDTFADDAMVFSVQKIEQVLRPVVTTPKQLSRIGQRAQALTYRDTCKGVSTREQTSQEAMPWNLYDILERPVSNVDNTNTL